MHLSKLRISAMGLACAVAAGVYAPGGSAMSQTILHYEFEGEPGTVPMEILDSSGNDRHGDVVGDPFFVANDPGAGDAALDFTDDRIAFDLIPELTELAVDGDVTVEAIVKPRSTGLAFIVSNWRIFEWQFTLATQVPNDFVIAFNDGAHPTSSDTASLPVPCCRWYHLAGVRDSQAGEVRLYVDGTLVASNPLTMGLSTANDAFAIGARFNGTVPFDGLIAEVRISATVLGPAEFLTSISEDCGCPWDCGIVDGSVGIIDFLVLLSQWGQPGTSCDVHCDNTVDDLDFADLLANWGPCP